MSVGGAATIARTLRARIDGLEFRTARAMLRRAEERPIDVLYLGDSMNYAFAVEGGVATLGDMLAEEYGGDVNTFTLAGGGYHPGLWQAYLNLLPPEQSPRIVIHALGTRIPMRPWAEHPLYHYRQQIEVLRAVGAGAPRRRLHGGFPPPSRDDMRAYQELRYETLLGEHSMRDYQRLCSTGEPEDRVRWLYAFHHTGVLTPDAPGFVALREFATELGRRQCRVIAFHAPVCMPRGRELLGPQFDAIVEHNTALLEQTYRSHLDGADVTVLPLTSAFEREEFADPDDATEHLNGYGRRRLAKLLVAESTVGAS
jgi:hypothetical protein